jgi:DNA adenine methylase
MGSWVGRRTIAVSDDVWAMLNELKLELGARTLNDVILKLLERYFEVEFTEFVREVYGEADVDRSKPLTFPGGDWWIKDKLLDLISRSGCRVLVEVFGGSGVVSMYAPRNQFKVIVYNDIDGLLTNFFEVLRDRPRELRERLLKMPASRREVAKYAEMIVSGEVEKLDPVEKAAVWFYVVSLSFDSKVVGGFSVERWRSKAVTLSRKLISLEEYAKRWAGVSIENMDFRKVITAYDTPNTVFYCDPPHLPVTGKERKDYYRFRFTEQDMRDLLNLLDNIKGKFVLRLTSDNLEYDFIKRWIEKYKVETVEHGLFMAKSKGEARSRLTTLLIYNY